MLNSWRILTHNYKYGGFEMVYSNLPRTQVDILNGGLYPKAGKSNKKKSIMIIGTAPYGPINKAIKCASDSEVLQTFGATSDSTLYKSFIEAQGGEYRATNFTDELYLVRLSNGNLASVSLPESPQSPTNEYAISSDEAGAIQDAVTITSLYPGAIYNGISFTTTFQNGILYIKATNPITGVASLYRYSTTVTGDSIVSDCKTFVDAINNDPNIGSLCRATYHDLEVDYEMDLIDPDVETTARSAGITWIDKTEGTFKLNLPTKLDVCDTDDDWITESNVIHYPSSTTAKPVPTTSANRILEIDSFYEVSRDRFEIEMAGYDSAKLSVKDHVDRYDRALPLLDYGNYTTAVPGVNDSMVQAPRNLYVGTGDGDTKIFYWSAKAAVNPLAVDSDGNTILKVYWQYEGDDSKLLQPASSYTLDNSDVVLNERMEITFDANVPDTAVVLINYDSVEIELTVLDSLVAVQASTDWASYFISGDYIYFGATQPMRIKIAYLNKYTYGVGSDVVLTDAKLGIISFPSGKCPYIQNTAGTTCGIELHYQPEFISLSASFSLQDGSDGIGMTNNEKYELLDTFLDDYADAYPVDLMVPIGFHLDSTKKQFNEDTGYQTDVNAGYHLLLDKWCAAHRDVHETHCILSVIPPSNNDPDVVNEWFRKLVYTSTLDANRAANIMNTFDSKWVSVTAMAPIFANDASNGVAYKPKENKGGDGVAAYAGLIAALNVEATQAVYEAATNKPLGGIVGSYIILGDKKINELVGRRYVALRNIPNIGLVIASDVTCDTFQGDFHFFSNFECVQHVTNAVRIVCFPFIGQGWNQDQKAAMETALQRLFDELVSRRILVGGNFKIVSSSAELVRGIINLNLVLVPSLQIQVIKVTVKLRPNLV
jgi:hypothetical protein